MMMHISDSKSHLQGLFTVNGSIFGRTENFGYFMTYNYYYYNSKKKVNKIEYEKGVQN